MSKNFDEFRLQVRADFELTQALIRNTVRRQEAQGEMLQQQGELLHSLTHHQLEGIKDFRRLEKGMKRIASSVDGALGALAESASRTELEALEKRVRALEEKQDAA